MLKTALALVCALAAVACAPEPGIPSGGEAADGGDLFTIPPGPDAGGGDAGSIDEADAGVSDAGSLDGEADAGIGKDAGTTASNPNPHAPQATVVLVHGMGGFKTLLGVDYFYGVPEAWRAAGANVVVVSMTPLQSIEDRAAQIKAQLDGLPGPFIFVAHSQGGLDARYLVSQLGYGERTKAVVTLSSPHHGTPIADIAVGIVPGPAVDVINSLLGLMGWSLEDAEEMTTSHMDNVFNPSTPDVPGVLYWSFSGKADPLALNGDGWLQPGFDLTWSLLEGEGVVSDGLVPEASAHWGQFRGVMTADHLEEVGQPLGFTPAFDHVAFYANLLQALHDQGL